jgi:class 3 adenylate cyclase/tetratricopeptide (TPR) repeat protein
MKCPRCERENPQSQKFCGECGTSLASICPSCRAANPPSQKFCEACHAPLTETATGRFATPKAYTPEYLAEKILLSRATLEGERKFVTVLFCDIVDSSVIAHRIGPETMHVMLDRFFALALESVHRYEGTINQFLGDGFMALFGAPVSHEDHGRRAVLAAIDIRRALLDERSTFVALAGGELSVRIGVNTGLVLVGKIGDNLRMDYTAVGDTTNLAARLQQAAQPGEVLLSGSTTRLVKGYVRVEASPPLSPKGSPEPIVAWRLVGPALHSPSFEGRGVRTLTQFIGRERELAALHDALARAEDGHAQIVGIRGDPGVGKSRLLLEFRRSVGHRRVTYLEGHCLSYGRAVPYLPIQDILRRTYRITMTDDASITAGKLARVLKRMELPPAESAPTLLRLLGVTQLSDSLSHLSADAVRARLRDVLAEMVRRGARQRPLVLAIENLHWIDRTSEALLASMLDHVADARVVILLTHRHGSQVPILDRPDVGQISLAPLPPEHSRRLVRIAAAPRVLPEPLEDKILAKAEGNPLFLEELTRALAPDRAEIGPDTIPDTIQSLFAARLDILPDSVKRALQIASVLGRDFPSQLLTAVWDGRDDIHECLDELKRRELVHEVPGGDEPSFAFRHALAQDAAYNSLPLHRRSFIHRAAGQALEVLHRDVLPSVYDQLAYHYARTEDRDKAVHYLTRWSELAAFSHGHAEALLALREARRHLQAGPHEAEQILDLVLREAQSLYPLGRIAEMLEVLLANASALSSVDSPQLKARYHFQLGFTYQLLGKYESVLAHQQETIVAARRIDDRAMLGKAYYSLAYAKSSIGQYREGVELARVAVEFLTETQERWWLGMAHWVIGLTGGYTGEFQSALEALEEARRIGEATDDKRLQSFAAWTAGGVLSTRGDWERGIEHCRRALELATDPVSTAYASAMLGCAHVENGEGEPAIPLLRDGVGKLDQFGLRLVQAFFTVQLAEAYRLTGAAEQARQFAMQGLNTSLDTAYAYGAARARHVLGRLALDVAEFPAAGEYLGTARQQFEDVGARFEVGRVMLSVAELARRRGDAAQAARIAQEANAIFTDLDAPRYRELARGVLDPR